MRLRHSFFAVLSTFVSSFPSAFISKLRRRKILSLILILSLLILPMPSLASSSWQSLTASAVNLMSAAFHLPPYFLRHLFGSTTPDRDDTLEDRLAQISRIRVTPNKFVGYENQRVKFSAIGFNSGGQVIQGATFTWEAADSSRITFDETGRATLLQSGLTQITCRAGNAQTTVQVLIRPGSRPLQTYLEWLQDQNLLPDPVETPTGVGAIVPTLLDKLFPTAHAQGGSYGTDYGFDELWSEPRNLFGNSLNRVIEPTTIGAVQPEGSNFHFSIPLIGLGGRGIGASLSLFYNSRIWARRGNYVTFSPLVGNPSPGFALGFGRVLAYGTSSSMKYVLIDPDGAMHYLGVGSGTTNGTYQTTDGTHITFYGCATSGGTLSYNDGTKVDVGGSGSTGSLPPSQITDSNGNYIQMTSSSVTDTKGRVMQFNYDTSGRLSSITAPGYGGTAQNPVTRTVAQFDYETRTISYNFSGLTVENTPSGSISVLKHVYFPATNTGYKFDYSDYGMIYSVSKRRQMSINSNGVISDGTESSTTTFNYPTSGSTQLTDAPAFTQRTESAPNTTSGTFSYSSSTNSGAQTKTFTIARPDSSNLALTRSTDSSSAANGLLVQSEITKNSTTYSKTVTTYATDGGNNVQPQTIIISDDASNATKVDLDYDSYGNITNKREYGFQISGNWQVRRRTHFTYKTDTAYLNAYLRSLVTAAEVYDALQNTNDNDDVLIAKTTTTYDDYQATGGIYDPGSTPKPPGHLSNVYTASYTLRGNVTGTTAYSDVVNNITLPTRLKKYDKFGNVLQEQVSCCKEKVFTYQSSDYWADPKDITQGDPQGLHLKGTPKYDFNTGLLKEIQTPSTGKITYTYDAALRQTQMDYPSSYTESTSYNDNAMSVTQSKTNLGSSTVNYDGWGRVASQVDPGNGQVNTSYNTMGRVSSRSNPFTAGGTPGAASSFTYDALGRATVVTLPDSQTIQTNYNGVTATVTDQVNRKIKRENDGLGRLVKVTEQDTVTGNLTQETTYTYNLLNKLVGINQGNQMRAWQYDALSRLTYERIPEQTATINDGTGTLWTMKYTYTDFSAVQTRTDARGVVTTYGYDGINRPTGIGYNVSNAPGVATTPAVSYTYDINQQSATNGLLLSTSVGTNYTESYSYNSFKQMNSITRTIDSANYQTPYGLNSAGVRTQITYPSGRVVNLNRDSAGRLTSMTDGNSANYLSGISYNATGQVTGLTLGNGVVEGYGYDANRLQLTSQTASIGTTSLLNLTYSYAASSGQNGAGSTAGNSGQLMSISGTIAGATESAAYIYDNLGRLVTSNQTTNGTTAQRRFVYDRFGNRTAVYDATSGGNQIQSVSISTTLVPPMTLVANNKVASATAGGVTKNYSHDNAGNVTNDGDHSYTYDAENRLVSVDSGNSANYSYDQNNRRIKKTIGSTTTVYIWEGSQVVAEYDVSSSTLQAEFIYYGPRMLARYANGTTRYYLRDRLSKRLTLDASGNVVGKQSHLPFGETVAASGEQEKYHFTSYERDSEIDSDNAINRQAFQNIGRFNRPDPAPLNKENPLIIGSYGDPQSLNRYTYVRNDPINYTDPLGLNLCYGYNVYLNIIDMNTGEIVFSIYLGFITLYCDQSAGGGGQGSGGGGGQLGDGRTPHDKQIEELRDAFKTFVDNMSNDCKTALSGYINQLKSKAGTVGLYDVADNPSAKAWKFVGEQAARDIAGDAWRSLSLIIWFNSRQHDAFTATNVPKPGIYFSNVRTFRGDGGMYLLLHEMMHTLVGPPPGSSDLDLGLANMLGITKASDETWSQAVSRFFNSQCKEKSPPPK